MKMRFDKSFKVVFETQPFYFLRPNTLQSIWVFRHKYHPKSQPKSIVTQSLNEPC